MPRTKKNKIPTTNFETLPTIEINGFVINNGDIIKIYGEYGSKFKFIGITTNTITGSQWIDCFEIINGVPSVFRSFKQERIKRIPKKRGRRPRNVGRTGSD